MSDTTDELRRATAARYIADPCGKTERITKQSGPYLLVCQLHADHPGRCKDIDNWSWFEPDGPHR